MTQEMLQKMVEAPRTFLNRGAHAKTRIAAKQERLRHWQALSQTIQTDSVYTSNENICVQAKTYEAVQTIETLRNEILAEISGIIEDEAEIRKYISEYVQTEKYKLLLELRYCNHLKEEDIERRLGISHTYVQAGIKRALDDFRIKESVPAELSNL